MINKLADFIYQKIVKPILFRVKPDTVHKRLVKLVQTVQKIPLVRELPKLVAYRNDKLLAQTFFGTNYRNPIGLSAGFDKEINMVQMMKAVGFGWMTGGSVTWGKYKGNDGAWFYRLPKSKSLVVNAGLPSEGAPIVAERVSGYKPSLLADFPLWVSSAKTNAKDTVNQEQAVEDYCASLAAFDKLNQVSMHEINISCPNTFGGEPFTTADKLEALLVGVDKLDLKKPITIKLPINLPLNDFDTLLDTIVSHSSVKAVTIGNLFKDRSAVKLSEVLPDDVKGSLSGEPTRQVTTELIRRTYQKHGDRLLIIGVGGVFSADHAYAKIRAGASLVALITGMIFEGPQVVGQINRDLVKLLERDGFSNVSQAIGVDAK